MSRLTRFSSLSLCIASSLLALTVGLVVGDLLLPHPAGPATAAVDVSAALPPPPVAGRWVPYGLRGPAPTTTTVAPAPTTTTATTVAPRVVETPVRTSPPTTVRAAPVVTIPAPPVPVASSSGSLASDFACIARYESGDTNDDTGNGYYGYFQFSASTWAAWSGLPGVASDYSYGTQLAAAEKLEAVDGWGPWPNTSRDCGL